MPNAISDCMTNAAVQGTGRSNATMHSRNEMPFAPQITNDHAVTRPNRFHSRSTLRPSNTPSMAWIPFSAHPAGRTAFRVFRPILSVGSGQCTAHTATPSDTTNNSPAPPRI